MSKRVVVAMSGGVDSSVAAALLVHHGYDVVGVTMCLLGDNGRVGGCCGMENIEDARKVAYKLGIPHYVINFGDVFRRKVVDNFIAEYLSGRTPNPCIRCNRYIKFEALWNKARALGAEYVATGHYARIVFDNSSDRYCLLQGSDLRKDQSYVLYVMTQQQLRHTLFPVGSLAKEDVRELARKLELPILDKRDSYEICFVDSDYGRFVAEAAGERVQPGPILDKSGIMLGQHPGIVYFTIGQRKGLGLSSNRIYYVVDIDSRKNAIVVGNRSDVMGKKLLVGNLNFVSVDQLVRPVRAKVKIRYMHEAADAVLYPEQKDTVSVEFDEPQWAITPGQAAVFYVETKAGMSILGGGTIVSRLR